MIRSTVRHGLRAGAIYASVLIFLVLIGFTGISSELIEEFLGFDPGPGGRTSGLAVFLVVCGLLAGWGGAPRRDDSSRSSLIGGLSSGALTGLVYVALALALRAVDQAGIDLRYYLVQLSAEAIDLLNFSKESSAGATAAGGLLAAAGALGGLARWAFAREYWRKVLGRWWSRLREATLGAALVRRFMEYRYSRVLLQAAAVGVVFLIPLYLGQYQNYTLGTVGIYVLMGLGLNIVVGLAGLLDLGYVAFFAVGAYTVGLLTSPEPLGVEWSFWVVLPLGVLIASFAGVLLGIPVLRLRGDYLAIVTLGFGEIIRILVKSDLLAAYLGGPQGIRDIAGPQVLGRPFISERAYMYLILLGIMLVVFVTVRLQNSRVGRAWIAMREDETVALATGVNVYRSKLLAFAIGAAFAGLGGVLFASRNQYTGPEDHNLMVSINVLCLVVVGGMGSIPGVVAGAFVLKGLPEALRQLQDYRLLAFGALLVAMMIWRPEGIWPSKRRRLEVHSDDEVPETIGPGPPEESGIETPGDLDQ